MATFEDEVHQLLLEKKNVLIKENRVMRAELKKLYAVRDTFDSSQQFRREYRGKITELHTKQQQDWDALQKELVFAVLRYVAAEIANATTSEMDNFKKNPALL